MARYKYSIINTSRWETETITEWVLYYRSIGFDHIYLYCNDDDPAEMYERLLPFIQQPDPYITFHHLPYQGQQDYCWMHFLENYKRETEWFLFVDADEFLVLRNVNDIHRFMKPREDRFDCIYFNWIWFGPQDFVERPGGSTLLQFTRRENQSTQMNYFTKTLTRSSCVDEKLISRPPEGMLNHNWPSGINARMRRANVLDEPMDSYFADFPTSAERHLSEASVREAIVEVACLYHYLFRSRRDFVRRFERGILGAYYFQPMWKTLYESPDIEPFIATLNSVTDTYLADYWRLYLAEAQSANIVAAKPNFENLALGSRATQSSTCQWSNNPDPQLDALGAVDGRYTGGDGFHTDEEQSPWWRTDLLSLCEIHEIRLFNSLKAAVTAERAYNFEIAVSSDGLEWRSLFQAHSRTPFGGVDGHPFILKLNPAIEARYVQVGLLTRAYFHLDQIEIYGERHTAVGEV